MSTGGRAHRSSRLLLYALLALGLAAGAALAYALMNYKSFHVPSEGMEPTFPKGDRFFARRIDRNDIRRGDVVLFRTPLGTYIQRIAGLPGDRIEMVGGVVVLNGTPVPQQAVGTGPGGAPADFGESRRLRERFPGEAEPHEILDLGRSTVDDMAEVTVRPGHLFLLGDNRDRSADSRVPREAQGAEQVPLKEVFARPAFHSFGSSESFGTRIGR